MLYKSYKYVPPDLLTSIDILPRKVGKRVGKNKRHYLNIVAAFDIETTNLDDDHSIMYIWQLQIGLHTTIIGRSWKEFIKLWEKLLKDIPDDVYLVIYVHNLSFEFSFLRGIYNFKNEEIFALDRRKVLRCDMFNHLEFRCSYIHTNMSLAVFLDKMGVENKKLYYDYSKKRYPWTALTREEINYCVNDVKGLVQALYIEMAHDGDSLYTTPATSTGFVRRDVKAAMRHLKYGVIRDMLPDWVTFELLREAFRGGNTHANRFFARQILKNVHSIDMTSAYPASQMLDSYPISAFYTVPDLSLKYIERLINVRKRAVLMRVILRNLELIDHFDGCPYLSDSKCRSIVSPVLDNGRLLAADYLETTITDLDYKIIKDQYNYDIEIIYAEHARYGKLPEVLKRVIMQYYKDKTELKGNEEKALLYTKSKNKLNAIYGMSATSPVKDDLIYVNGLLEYAGADLKEKLEENNKRAFFPYQWGVWTTAHVRSRLYWANKSIIDQGAEFIYCDTDSLKYIGDINLDIINHDILAAAKAFEAYADDPAGERHYLGVFEYEGKYDQFATRGAKKYAYEKDGKITATIAGVPKAGGRSGGDILKEKGGLRAFLDDVIIFDNKKLLKYNDSDRYMTRVDGHRLKVREGVTIIDGDYTLSDTEAYQDLILTEAELYAFKRDIMGIS